jgi:hypothetical protein
MTIKHYIYLAIAIALGTLGYLYRESLVNLGRSEVKAEVTEQALEQAAEATEKTAEYQGKKDDALESANKRAQANAAAASSARLELDRLRKQIADAPDVPGDTCSAAVNRADALGDVFGECSTALVDLAEKADGHANDAVMLYESWPAMAEFQDRLTTFKNSLKGNQ